MILESLNAIADPFQVRREQAEDAFDHRFKEAEVDCRHCEGWGSRLVEDLIIVKCGKCQGGSIYTLLCSRCGLNENGCQCNVEDFLR